MEKFKYLDGNGNTYIIKNEGKKIIEYVPLKPALSSSGYYDGGDYIKTEISELQYNKILSIINEAIRNKESHIKNRVKMSGMIKKEKKTYILRPNSKELNKIEKTLKETL